MSTNSTFIAYIDESGDEGFTFRDDPTKSSKPWLVLAAMVFRRSNESEQLEVISQIRADIYAKRSCLHQSRINKPIHFSNLNHEHRKHCALQVGQIEGKSICVLINKTALTEKKFQEPQRLYQYASGLLSERISWYCRDHFPKDDLGDGSVELIFSHRKITDYEALKDYLFKLKVSSRFNFAPNILRADLLRSEPHGKMAGLQIADIVASSYGYYLNPGSLGLTEDSYRKYVMPCVYRYNGKIEGYGEKYFPKETSKEKSLREAYEYLEKIQRKLAA